MPEARSPNRPVATSTLADASTLALRQLGNRAHQLRAATRAADHFTALDGDEDRNTGSWLMSCALGLADELASDIDSLARSTKQSTTEVAQLQNVAALRVNAHQLHAATRAADHYLDQESHDDRDTGSWLIACALRLAEKLAAQIDDNVAPSRRPPIDKTTLEPHDAQLARRVTAATTPIRGAA